MTRHWRPCALLFFVLLVLAACRAVDSQEEMVEVGAISTAPILPTPSPEPSATELPIETATIAPTPQPSPTPQEPTITPTPDIPLGQVRDGPDTRAIEVWVGEWATPPLAEGFDPAHMVLENNQVHYRSPGLTQVWSVEESAWVFPDVFPYKVGEVVPVSLMGGQLEIADQAAAWQAHQDMVLAWLNNQGNAEFLQAVYGKSNIGWEDLQTTDETDQTKYEINLVGLNGEIKWPQVIIISNTGDVRYWTLADYIDDKATFGTKIDVSSPLWIVAGPDDWESGGIREFADKHLDGPDIFGVSWAKHGLRFTREGRIVWEASSRNLAPKPEVDFIVLGEQPTLQDNARLSQAYLASTINTFEKVNPHTENTYPIPFFASAGIPGITVEDGTGINSLEEVDSILPNPILRALE